MFNYAEQRKIKMQYPYYPGDKNYDGKVHEIIPRKLARIPNTNNFYVLLYIDNNKLFYTVLKRNEDSSFLKMPMIKYDLETKLYLSSIITMFGKKCDLSILPDTIGCKTSTIAKGKEEKNETATATAAPGAPKGPTPPQNQQSNNNQANQSAGRNIYHEPNSNYHFIPKELYDQIPIKSGLRVKVDFTYANRANEALNSGELVMVHNSTMETAIVTNILRRANVKDHTINIQSINGKKPKKIYRYTDQDNNRYIEEKAVKEIFGKKADALSEYRESITLTNNKGNHYQVNLININEIGDSLYANIISSPNVDYFLSFIDYSITIEKEKAKKM